MLTHDDEQKIKRIITEELNEKLRFVPTKDLFLEKMDMVMGELKKIREDADAHVGLHEDIDEKIEIISKKRGFSV